jgi:hypothetical protein
MYDEKMAQLRSDYPRAKRRARPSTAERCVLFVRSVRPQLHWRSAAIISKFFTIGAVVAALAAPTTAAGHGVRARHARGQISCPQAVVFPPRRNYGVCGHRFWVRDPQSGQVKAIPFWRLQRLSDPSEDRP